MATHAGLAIELGITRKKGLSPQMEAILIWCPGPESTTMSTSMISHNPGQMVWPSVHSYTTSSPMPLTSDP